MELIKYARICDECGKGMNRGYVIDGGEQYYCSDECLHQNITKEEWDETDTDDGDSYWTEWEDVEDDDYALGDEDGNIIKKTN